MNIGNVQGLHQNPNIGWKANEVSTRPATSWTKSVVCITETSLFSFQEKRQGFSIEAWPLVYIR